MITALGVVQVWMWQLEVHSVKPTFSFAFPAYSAHDRNMGQVTSDNVHEFAWINVRAC